MTSLSLISHHIGASPSASQFHRRLPRQPSPPPLSLRLLPPTPRRMPTAAQVTLRAFGLPKSPPHGHHCPSPSPAASHAKEDARRCPSPSSAAFGLPSVHPHRPVPHLFFSLPHQHPQLPHHRRLLLTINTLHHPKDPPHVAPSASLDDTTFRFLTNVSCLHAVSGSR